MLPGDRLGVLGCGEEVESRLVVVQRVRQRLPFPLLGLDSENGSEFISRHLLTHCQREKITFTLSRSYKGKRQLPCGANELLNSATRGGL
jgi:hypothetical protein